MVINLNRKPVSKDALLERINETDVYRYYLQQDIKLNKTYSSPFREDRNPSLSFFVNTKNEICFNDFKVGGDYVKFVELLFNLNYYEALSQIVADFNLGAHFFCKSMTKSNSHCPNIDDKIKKNFIELAEKKVLRKKRRPWKAHDILFWKQFNITKEILEKYNVEPIEYIFYDLDNPPLKADRFAYCFKEFKDNKLTFKIYQPFNKEFKWLNNHDASIWQGWDQLPEKGDYLIITKSLKDVMSITNTLNIPAVALQSETTLPKDKIIKELEERFKSIKIFYDNDFDKEVNEGQKYAKQLQKKYFFDNIVIPRGYNSKDFSDFVKMVGPEQAKRIFFGELFIPF